MPTLDNSVVRLSRAIQGLADKGLPMHVTRPVESFLKQLAATQPFPVSSIMKGLLNPVLHNLILKILPDKDQAKNFTAFLHNTASPTVLNAGGKVNVIPSTASVTLDCRILPGQDVESLLAELKQVVGDDLEFEVLRSAQPNEVPHDTPLFELLARNLKKADPEGIPIPFMLVAFTDAHHYARLGIKTYGFTPVKLDPAIVFQKLPHGIDERIPLDGFLSGFKLFYETVSEWVTN
jgi:acetylornithine deacetylase/succinyl-diaminopimelate desuccinylase-like protein